MIKKTFKGDKVNVAISELLLLSLDEKKTYDLVIKEHRRKRSLDANAYCWVLLGKLGEKLHIPSEEIYREFIHRVGSYEILPVREKAVDKFKEGWQSNGIAWIVEDLGESKLEGYINLRCFYGSSSYDTLEMSRLLDEIVSACKEQGIETATGAELALLMEEWGK